MRIDQLKVGELYWDALNKEFAVVQEVSSVMAKIDSHDPNLYDHRWVPGIKYRYIYPTTGESKFYTGSPNGKITFVHVNDLTDSDLVYWRPRGQDHR